MGKIERKIRQSIRREAHADFERIKLNIARNKPWWCPKIIWNPLVSAVLNSSAKAAERAGRHLTHDG